MRWSSVVLFLISADAFAQSEPSIQGSIGRGSATSFQITVTVTNITNITLTGTETDLTKDRLYIFLPSISTTTPVPYDTVVDTVAMPFYATETATRVQTDTGNGTYKMVYSVKISEASGSGALKTRLLAGGTSIRVYAQYWENKIAKTTNTTATTLTVNPAIAKSAPVNFAAEAIAYGVKATWTPASSVDFVGADGATVSGTIEGTALVAIAKTTGSTSLPAMTFTPGATTDVAASAGTCNYDSNFKNDGDACITCKDATINYLDVESLKLLEPVGIHVITTSNTGASELTRDHLEPDTAYSVFMFNLPGGLERTGCYHVTPYEGFTLAQQNGESKSEDNPRCFIATAAYGSPLHRNLKLFTWFREHVLLKHSWGKSFVHWYNIYGPPAAAVVANHPALALGARTVLWVPAIGISVWLGLANQDPVAIGSVMVVLAAAAYFLIKRRRTAIL